MRLLPVVLVLLSACSQTQNLARNHYTQQSEYVRQVMYRCAELTRDNQAYAACLIANRATI